MNKNLLAALYAFLVITLLSLGFYYVLFHSLITTINIKPNITKEVSQINESQYEHQPKQEVFQKDTQPKQQQEQEKSQEDIQCESDSKTWIDEKNAQAVNKPETDYDKHYYYLDSHYSPKLKACLVYYSNPLLTIKKDEFAKTTVFYGIYDITNDKNLYFTTMEGITPVKDSLFSE